MWLMLQKLQLRVQPREVSMTSIREYMKWYPPVRRRRSRTGSFRRDKSQSSPVSLWIHSFPRL